MPACTSYDHHRETDLVLEEEASYPDLDALSTGAEAVQGPSGWVYHSTSFGCLRPFHWPRRLAIRIVEHPLFDPLILATIIANCMAMAWNSPVDPPGTPKQALLAVLDSVFLAVFTFELVTKSVAYGLLFHQHSYLRDAWCQLDFVVVTLAWLPILFPSYFGDTSAIRAIRAFRPLRALKRIPGMPLLVGTILRSLPALGSVVGLTGFIFTTFGVVGFNLFKGVLHYRCAEPGINGLPEAVGDALAGSRRALKGGGSSKEAGRCGRVGVRHPARRISHMLSQQVIFSSP